MTAETEAMARALASRDLVDGWMITNANAAGLSLAELHTAFIVEGAVVLLAQANAAENLRERSEQLVADHRETVLAKALDRIQPPSNRLLRDVF